MNLEQLVKDNSVLDGKGRRVFDKRSHIRDPKTGKIVKVQIYREIRQRGKEPIFERPVGSGVMFHGNGELYKHPYDTNDLKSDSVSVNELKEVLSDVSKDEKLESELLKDPPKDEYKSKSGPEIFVPRKK